MTASTTATTKTVPSPEADLAEPRRRLAVFLQRRGAKNAQVELVDEALMNELCNWPTKDSVAKIATLASKHLPALPTEFSISRLQKIEAAIAQFFRETTGRTM